MCTEAPIQLHSTITASATGVVTSLSRESFAFRAAPGTAMHRLRDRPLAAPTLEGGLEDLSESLLEGLGSDDLPVDFGLGLGDGDNLLALLPHLIALGAGHDAPVGREHLDRIGIAFAFIDGQGPLEEADEAWCLFVQDLLAR